MTNFVIKKIILQREEKIHILKRILDNTLPSDAKKSIIFQIKDQQKDLKYFENLMDKKIGMEVFL